MSEREQLARKWADIVAGVQSSDPARRRAARDLSVLETVRVLESGGLQPAPLPPMPAPLRGRNLESLAERDAELPREEVAAIRSWIHDVELAETQDAATVEGLLLLAVRAAHRAQQGVETMGRAAEALLGALTRLYGVSAPPPRDLASIRAAAVSATRRWHVVSSRVRHHEWRVTQTGGGGGWS